MTRHAMPWRVLLAGMLLASALPLLGPVGPAAAAACSGTSGVTVVVDSSVGCAPGDPSSALAALHAAGHSTTMVAPPNTAFLCRIDGAPASDACMRIPPSSAYWSFWTARRGGGWTYASTAVPELDPAPGTVVGFSFGSGGPPPITPPAASVAPKPKPTARASTPTTTTAPGVTATRTATPTHGSAAPATPSRGTAAPTVSPTATASPEVDAPPSSSPIPLGPTEPTSATTPLASSGVLSLGLGGALVAALGAATAYVVRRRRA